MILKKKMQPPIRYRDGELRQQSKFAFFPTKMMESSDDTRGEIIWLESYIETYKFFAEGWGGDWNFHSKTRKSEEFLKKLEH
jgi:hypothetical protein